MIENGNFCQIKPIGEKNLPTKDQFDTYYCPTI